MSSDIPLVRRATAIDSKEQLGSMEAKSIGALSNSGMAASLSVQSSWKNNAVKWAIISTYFTKFTSF